MKLVERMPRVCKAVIKAKAGYFEESRLKWSNNSKSIVQGLFQMMAFRLNTATSYELLWDMAFLFHSAKFKYILLTMKSYQIMAGDLSAYVVS